MKIELENPVSRNSKESLPSSRTQVDVRVSGLEDKSPNK